MSPTLAIIFAVLSTLATTYAIYDMWRKRQASHSVEVMQSAVNLLGPYKEEVAQLRKDLVEANLTIMDLKNRLGQADLRASELNKELGDARTEVAYLRLQVHTLCSQVEKGM